MHDASLVLPEEEMAKKNRGKAKPILYLSTGNLQSSSSIRIIHSVPENCESRKKSATI